MEIALKRFLPREVALSLWMDTWDVLHPQLDFPPLPQKLLIKAGENIHFSSPLSDAYSLCLTRDRMTGRFPCLSFNHIQIVCYV